MKHIQLNSLFFLILSADLYFPRLSMVQLRFVWADLFEFLNICICI